MYKLNIIKFVLIVILIYICDKLDRIFKIENKTFLKILLRLVAIALFFIIINIIQYIN